jgi:thymidylate synthase
MYIFIIYIAMFSTIVAVSDKGGIGKNNDIPWKVKEDLAFFKSMTLHQVVIMGGSTFRSMKCKPLPLRLNLVVSLSPDIKDNPEQGLKVFRDIWECVRYASKSAECKGKKLFIIGGATIYNWFFKYRLIQEEYITHICSPDVNDGLECDRFYPVDVLALHKELTPIQASNDYIIFHKVHNNLEEEAMLGLMRELLTSGNQRMERTGVGAASLFGRQLSFNLLDNAFPLMTTRPMFVRGIFEELMLYIRGQTDSKILESKGVPVWKGNTTRAFLDSRGLQRLPEGDMGHSYGFSFRHYGGKYINCKSNYDGVGYDQLQSVMTSLKEEPYGRRHIIDLWEPNFAHLAALPPCLYNYQFYVSDGYLDCMMTQRSSDFAVAGGWNVATGALLTYFISHYVGLKPRRLIWNLGDVHLYNNAVESIRQQITRTPYRYPLLFLRNMPEKIEQIELNNIEIMCYRTHPKLEFVMNQ